MAQEPGTPSSFCTRQATLGKGPSGEEVATRIMSSSEAATPDRSRASRAAAVASSNVGVPGSAIRRSRIPVRSAIHWSVVSTVRSSSAFVTIRSGTYWSGFSVNSVGHGLT